MAPSLMREFRQLPTQTGVLVQHMAKARGTTKAQAEGCCSKSFKTTNLQKWDLACSEWSIQCTFYAKSLSRELKYQMKVNLKSEGSRVEFTE